MKKLNFFPYSYLGLVYLFLLDLISLWIRLCYKVGNLIFPQAKGKNDLYYEARYGIGLNDWYRLIKEIKNGS